MIILPLRDSALQETHTADRHYRKIEIEKNATIKMLYVCDSSIAFSWSHG